MFVQNYICQPIFYQYLLTFYLRKVIKCVVVSTLSNSQSCEQIKKYFKLR